MLNLFSILFHASRVYLIKVKVNIYLFFFLNQLLFCCWINKCFILLTMLLFIKLFINVASLHLSANWQFWPFKGCRLTFPRGLMNCATVGGGGGGGGVGGRPRGGKSPGGGGGQPKWGIKPRGGRSKCFDNSI